jgi:hypothetical protein
MRSNTKSLARTGYDDAYATCANTYATFRAYTGELEPDEVSRMLGMQPSSSVTKGKMNTNHPPRKVSKLNGWFLSSKGHVESKDLRRHLDWLLEALAARRVEFLALQAIPNVTMDVSCYWLTRSGHGGPTLSLKQMRALCELNLDIWFDCY